MCVSVLLVCFWFVLVCLRMGWGSETTSASKGSFLPPIHIHPIRMASSSSSSSSSSITILPSIPPSIALASPPFFPHSEMPPTFILLLLPSSSLTKNSRPYFACQCDPSLMRQDQLDKEGLTAWLLVVLISFEYVFVCTVFMFVFVLVFVLVWVT